MNKNDVADNLFEAIDIIINKKISELKLDKTVLMTVLYPVDKNGLKITQANINAFRYKVKYQDNIFTVQSLGLVAYVPNQMVWVLIPQGNMGNEKIIIGQVENNFKENILKSELSKITALEARVKALEDLEARVKALEDLEARVKALENKHK